LKHLLIISGRDEGYLKTTISFTDQFVINAGLMSLIPNLLRPILGPIIAIPTRYINWKIKKFFTPLYKQRMELLKAPTTEKDPSDPLDLLQMMLQYAQTDRKEELNLHDMTRRLAMSNLGSYHQTSIAITNILFNIIASDAEYNTISVLREEVIRTTKEHGKEWNKSRVAKMLHADSVCRETLRLHSFGGRGPLRVVMVDDLRTEDGILLPKGAMVSILGAPAQCDEENFIDPFHFDPFRFSRIREAAAAGSEETMVKDENGKMGQAEKLTFVSTGSQHLAFGHGRHACPGRFLLDFELKMMIAYLVTNYDFEFPKEYGGQRPKGAWMAEAYMPPAAGRIRVKRKTANCET
jgi:cytochrome P450